MQPEVAKLLHALQLSGPKARRIASMSGRLHITSPLCKYIAESLTSRPMSCRPTWRLALGATQLWTRA